MKVGLTVSDKGTRASARTRSGPAIMEVVKAGRADRPGQDRCRRVDEIRAAFVQWSDEGLDLILTIGGRVQPSRPDAEATKAVIERETPDSPEPCAARNGRDADGHAQPGCGRDPEGHPDRRLAGERRPCVKASRPSCRLSPTASRSSRARHPNAASPEQLTFFLSV